MLLVSYNIMDYIDMLPKKAITKYAKNENLTHICHKIKVYK